MRGINYPKPSREEERKRTEEMDRSKWATSPVFPPGSEEDSQWQQKNSLSVGARSFIYLTEKLGQHLDQKFSELERVRIAPEVIDGAMDVHMMQSLWEDFPRRSTFYLEFIRNWIAASSTFMRDVIEEVFLWGRWPFTLKEKFGAVRTSDESMNSIGEFVWSRSVADIIIHVMRYSNYNRDLKGIHDLAVKHITSLLLNQQNESPNLFKDLAGRMLAQALFQWASIIGEICKRNHAFISRMLCDDVPMLGWTFVDISVVPVQVAREVLTILAEKLSKAKLDKSSRLVCLYVMDNIMERIEFRELEKTERKWDLAFKDLVVPRIYKAAEQFAKSDELKAASLSLMQTILLHSPKAYYEANYNSFSSKRVVRHLTEPRKVAHSLEIILRSLRNPSYKRPILAWDAFEQYDPKLRSTFHPSPLAQPSLMNRKSMENLFVEIFEKPKSKALISLFGSLSGGNAEIASINPYTINAVAAAAAAAGVSSVGSTSTGSSSNVLGSSSASQPNASFAVPLGGSGSVANISQSNSPNLGTATLKAQLTLPRHLRACKHILLHMAAHDIEFFIRRALPSLLQVPEDLQKCSVSTANRIIVGLRVLWDILCPGYSSFRSTAYSLTSTSTHSQKEALKKIIDFAQLALPNLLHALDSTVGIEAVGTSEFALAPTVLWDSCKSSTMSSSRQPEEPNGGLSGSVLPGSTATSHLFTTQEAQASSKTIPVDRIGDELGFAFAWCDPDRNDLETFTFSSDGFVLEIQHLGVLQDMFDSGGVTAFRARNEKDKRSAELQIQHWVRAKQAVLKKKVTGTALDMLRELLYCLPILSCGTHLTSEEMETRRLARVIPPVHFLLHADWSVASAASHSYQRIITNSKFNQPRYVIVQKLVAAIIDCLGGTVSSVRSILTYQRQLLLLLRLWIFVRACQDSDCNESATVPLLAKDEPSNLITVAISLLAFPCTTVRLHAKEMLECCKVLWPQIAATETILSVLENRSMESFSCVLGSSCFCSSTTHSGTTLASFRRRTLDESKKQSSGSMRFEKHSSVPLPRPNSVSDLLKSNAVSQNAKGSSARFEKCFNPIKVKGHSRDELFMWYQSSTSLLSISQNMGQGTNDVSPRAKGKASPSSPIALARSMSPLSPTSPRQTKLQPSSPIGGVPLGLQQASTAKDCDNSGDGTEGDNKWRFELVRLASRLVDCASIHNFLFRSNEITLAWIKKLPRFTIDMTSFQLASRMSATSLAIALAGCDPNAFTTSPHSIAPSHYKWPGILEKDIETMVVDIWNQAERINANSEIRAILLYSLQEIVGFSSHKNCVGRYVGLLSDWRRQKLAELESAGASPRRGHADSSSKFNLFSRSRGNVSSHHLNTNSNSSSDSGSAGAFGVPGSDRGSATIQGRRIQLERNAVSTLRLLLETQRKGLPGWESALRECFNVLSDIYDHETVQDWDLGFSLDFVKFVLQCSKSVSAEISFVEDMEEVVRIADSVWPRAERRGIWKLLQRLAGYDELPIFSIRASSSSSSNVVTGQIVSISSSSSNSSLSTLGNNGAVPRTGSSDPVLLPESPSRHTPSRLQKEQKVIGEEDFMTVRNMVSRTAAAMLCLGPTSLGSVAPKPDEMLWAWMYHDEQRKSIGTEEKLLCNYLTAHWHVGDVESAGGGTFGPFLDRWYEEVLKRNSSNADAIFLAIFQAIRTWLLRGLRLRFERPLEPMMIPCIALLGLIQIRTHSNPDIRAKAFQLLDIVERSCSRSGVPNRTFDFFLGSSLSALSVSSHEAIIKRTALEASQVLAERCPVLAPTVVSELCNRMPSLVHGGIAREVVDVVLSWCQSSSTTVSPLDVVVSDIAVTNSLGQIVTPLPIRMDQPSARISAEQKSGDELRRESCSKTKLHVSLPELWSCCETLYYMEEKRGLNLILPIWRALCCHHATSVIDFLLFKFVSVNIAQRHDVREVGEFILSGLVLNVFETKPATIVEKLVVNVMYTLDILKLSPRLFLRSRGSFKADRPEALQQWVALALRDGPVGTIRQDGRDEFSSLESLSHLLEIQRNVLSALVVCVESNRSAAAIGFPIMATFCLCACLLGNSRLSLAEIDPLSSHLSGKSSRTLWYHLSEEITFPEHRCLSLLLRSLLHERKVQLKTSHVLNSAIGVNGGGTAENPSEDMLPDLRILELASISPSSYSDEQLKAVVEALLELFMYCDSSGKLVNLWCQCVLLTCLGVYHPRMVSCPAALIRSMKVYQYLRQCVPGGLCVLWGHRELSEEDSFRLELISFARVYISAVEAHMIEVAEIALSCLKHLDLNYVSPDLTSSLVTVYAKLADSEMEQSLLGLLTLLPVGRISQPLLCAPVVVRKLQYEIVRSLLDSVRERSHCLRKKKSQSKWSGEEVPPMELLLFKQMVQSGRPRELEVLFVTLFVLLCIDELEGRDLLLDALLDLPRIPSELRSCLKSFFSCPESESFRENALLQSCSFIGMVSFCKVLTELFLEFDGDKCLTGAVFTCCISCLRVLPETLAHFQTLLDSALSTEVDRNTKGYLAARDTFVQIAHQLSHQSRATTSGLRSDSSKNAMERTVTKNKLREEVDKHLREEIQDVYASINNELSTLSPTGSLASPIPGESMSFPIAVVPIQSTTDDTDATKPLSFHINSESSSPTPKSTSNKSVKSQEQPAAIGEASGTGEAELSPYELREYIVGGVASFDVAISDQFPDSSQVGEMDLEKSEDLSRDEDETKINMLAVQDPYTSSVLDLKAIHNSCWGSVFWSERSFMEFFGSTKNQERIARFLNESPVIEKEWIDFAISIAAFKLEPSLDKQVEIYETFIELDSIDTLDLDERVRDDIHVRVESGDEVDVGVFNAAVHTCMHFLEENFLPEFFRCVHFCEDLGEYEC